MRRFGKFLAVAALAMVSYSASAELAPQWSKGTMVANVNVGFDNVDFGTTASLDYVLVDEWWMGHFTVGGQVGYASWGNEYWKDNYIGIMPRVTYGLNITDQFEVHVAVGLGVEFEKEHYKVDDSHYSYTHTTSEELVGCRYFFTDNLAVMAEAGYSLHFPAFRVGISFKL